MFTALVLHILIYKALVFGQSPIAAARRNPVHEGERKLAGERTSGRTGRRSWLRRCRFGLVFLPNFCGALSERFGLCLVTHRFVKLGEVVETSGGLRMFRASSFFGNLDCAQGVRFGLLVFAFFTIKDTEIVESRASLVVIGSEFILKK